MLKQIDIETFLRMAVPSGQKGDGSLLYDCPRCGAKKRLELHRNGKIWFCHKCQVGGRSDRKKKSKGVDAEDTVSLLPDPDWMIENLTPILPGEPGWTRLKKVRSLSTKMVRELKPHRGPILGYWYFPFYNLGESQPCYFVARTWMGLEPKYLNPPIGLFPVRKSEIFWGLHRMAPGQDEVVLCEGIFDAIWDRKRLALLGKTVSRSQISILRKIGPKRVSVMLDGTAFREACSVARIIGMQLPCKVDVFRLPGKKDPDDFGRRSVERYRESFV